MTIIDGLIKKKNDWLYSQVDVKYPTAESIRGRKLYKAREQEMNYGKIEPDTASIAGEFEIFFADFHRLTIMFAQLTSGIWQDESERACVLEFLAQIILSDEHKIYLGFKDQEPAFAALVSADGQQTLISDIIIRTGFPLENQSVARLIAGELNLCEQELWFNKKS